jgi:outer membrane protein TolC
MGLTFTPASLNWRARWRAGATGVTCATLLLLGACTAARPPAQVDAHTPARWHTGHLPPSSAGGQADGPARDAAARESAARLRRWWQQLNDPLLLQLMARAQAASPSLASAQARVAEARAAWVAAGAARAPQLGATASAVRSNNSLGAGTGGASASPATVLQATLQPQWEIDLFGGLGAAQDAAALRLAGAQGQQASAQVALMAEVANAYFNERACRQQWAVARADAGSRAETARLMGLSQQAGFTAPADAALARAAAADAASRTRDAQTQCVLARQALVALTASDAGELAQQLDGRVQPPTQTESPTQTPTSAFAAAAPAHQSADVPAGDPHPAEGADWPPLRAVPSVPAQLLLQRPDVWAAEQAVAAASAGVGEAHAQRYPRLSLQGSVGRMQVRTQGMSPALGTWSLGPLALTVPLIDGGARRANVQASQARYDEAVVKLRASVRQAVQEVEGALTQWASHHARAEATDLAVQQYQRYWQATQARHQHGMASLFELEDARRSLLAAQLAQVAQRRDQTLAWVSLYRALGGGWLSPQAGVNEVDVDASQAGVGASERASEGASEGLGQAGVSAHRPASEAAADANANLSTNANVNVSGVQGS